MPTPAELDPNASSLPAVLMLDVGQGDASLIVLPGAPRRAIVVDCNDVHVVERHLRDFSVARLAGVVFTHLDADHIRGGAQLLRDWRHLTDVVYVDTDGRSVEDTQLARELLVVACSIEGTGDQPGPMLLTPSRLPWPIAAGEEWQVRIVAPFFGDRLPGGASLTPNQLSAVVRIDAGGRSVLIGGDATLTSWARLPPDEAACEVFRVPHHGGALDDGRPPDGWDGGRLAAATAPAHAVFSVGTANGHDHPTPVWREPFATREGCRVRCTQVTPHCHPMLGTTGADGKSQIDSEVAVALRLLALENPGRAEAAYRHLTTGGRAVSRAKSRVEVPCAGTVSTGFRRAGELVVLPAVREHNHVVDLFDQPWCRPPPEPLLDILDSLLD